MLQFMRLALSSAIVCVAMASQGADWPQFRHDAGRTAASSESLPAKLHLQWVRQMPAPRPAFPGEVRLAFDTSYEPVVMGKRMFVGSMVTDTVAALDTDTGEMLWAFFADGPVRFAPAAWQEKVYAASDDGFLYCLDAKTGALLWKFRGLPQEKSDRKLLGNGRLISLWPARGGPVLKDGVVYFAAGLWPSDGVFVHALDAVSGEPIWSNTESNRIAKANMDHGVAQLAGLTPQGYLALVGDQLVVPCGAQLPAFLSAKTGKLGAYTMGWGGRVGLPKGSWFVAGAGRHLSHSGDLYDITRASDEQFRDKRQANFKPMLYPGGFTRVLIEPKNQRELSAFREPVITEEALFVNDDEQGIVAYDLTRYQLQLRSASKPTAPRAADRYPDKWKAALRQQWQIATKSTVQIKAGSRLYAAGDGVIQAIDIPQADGEASVSWQTKIDGTPHRLLAADGKLFAVTTEGAICAFGQQEGLKARHALPTTPPWDIVAANDEITSFFNEADAHGGYVLLLGLKDRRTISHALSATDCNVIAVDADAEKVGLFRKWLHKAGFYGNRATVLADDPLSCPLPPLLASLIVCDDLSLVAIGDSDQSHLRSIARLLRPYGGQACLRTSEEERKQIEAAFECAALPGVKLKVTEHYVVLSREGGLPDAADWSHAAGNAANAGASQDRFLKPPLGMLWFDGSLRWHRKPGSAEVRISGGRAIVLADRMYAIDVFTGRRLWQRELPPGVTSRSQLVVVGKNIFVGAGDKCLVVDAANGTLLRDIARPSDLAGDWQNIRVAGDMLVGTIGRQLVCVDHRSSQLRWKFACGRTALSVAVAQDKVYCVELINPKRGESVAKTKTKMRALDLRTGKLTWEKPGGSTLRYSPDHELLISSAGVYDAATGEEIRRGVAAPQIVGDKIVSGTTDSFSVYNVATGELTSDPLKWYRRGCTGLRSSCHLVTTRFKANAAYVDLETREITSLWNIRPGCKNNLYPAEGILNVPNVTGGCECNYTPTSKAFVPLSLIGQRR